jgi:hypothetical protein
MSAEHEMEYGIVNRVNNSTSIRNEKEGRKHYYGRKDYHFKIMRWNTAK